MSNLSEQIIDSLSSYYDSEGIRPDNSFHCKHLEQCKGDLARGMQCHIGSKYGEKIRILVASLDCGGGGADFIKTRRDNVVKATLDDDLDRHMRGTYKALSYFYGIDDCRELVHYIAMTNTCKCCNKADSERPYDHLAPRYYRNCSEYSLAEIIRIKPQVILFQGKLAPTGCWDYLSKIDSIENPEIRNCLRYFDYQDLHCYAILCIHPSARGRSMKKKVHFYNNVLPKVAEYILENL